MALIHQGTADQLKELVKSTSIDGIWDQKNHGQQQFKSSDGAILNWWPTKGTISFQGKEAAKTRLEQQLTQLINNEETTSIQALPKKKVFVVYGHDQHSKTQLEAMLLRWKLEPIIMDQLPSSGQTIIEKLEAYSNEASYAVILATPDDEGHRTNHPDEKKFRARQNVVLELGMLLTKLGRPNVAILLKEQEKMERPSDIHGLVYIPFEEDLQKEAGTMLAKEMKKAGYSSIALENL